MTRRTGLLFALALALVVFVVDQGIKSVVEGSMRVGENIILMPGFLSLTYIKNDGGAFGILDGSDGVSIGVAAPEEPPPERLQPVLPAGRGPSRAYVLDK